MSEDNQPPERDVKDFQFRQLCKIRVSPSPTVIPSARAELIAASKYGITFVGTSSGFKAIQTEAIRQVDEQHMSERLSCIVTDIPTLADVTIAEPVIGIALSCDDLTLAVATKHTNVSVIQFYDIRSITTQMVPFLSVRLNGSPGSDLLDMAWNPVTPSLLVTCLSDGQLDMFEVSDKLGIRASQKGTGATCVCWSPKGKQLVVGRQDGSLMQYDPDLREKRKWDKPSILGNDHYQAMDIVWLSTFTFIVACVGQGADQPQLILINGSKDQPPTYANYEDICFGTGEDRQRKYLFNFVTKWDLVLAGSSNASEIGIIGKHLADKQSWEHWNLDDTARAEAPLTDDYGDTYPMGIAVDYTSQTPIALGDSINYPPCPLMLVLSTEGLIIPYHMMYSHPQTPSINAPAERLPTAGIRQAPTGQPSQPMGTSVSQSQPKNLFGAGQTAASKIQPKNLFGAGQTSTPASQSQPSNLFGAGQTATAASQSQPGNLFSAGQTPASQSQPSNLFGAGQTATAASQSQPANLFGAGQTSTPASQSETKTAFGAGLVSTSFSFAASTAPGISLAGANSNNQSSSGMSAASFSFSALQSATNAPFSLTTTGSDAGTATSTPAFGSSLPKPQFGAAAGFPASPSLGTATTSAPLFGGKGASPTFGGLSSTTTVTKTTIPASLPPSQPAGFGTGSTSAAGSGVQKRGAPVSSADSQPEKPSAEVAAAGQSSGFGMRPIATATPTIASGQPKPAAISKPVRPRSTSPAPKSPVQPPPQYVAPPSPEAAGAMADAREMISATVDHSFSKSILDEMQHFEKELRDLKSRAANSDVSVGSRDEMVALRQQTEQLDTFCSEIKSTVKEQSKEVQDQGTLCLDMFAMGEECRVREQMNSDPKYFHLLKSRSLDPGSADRLQRLQLQYQVLNQGLGDVDLILDTQWEEYQHRKKNKTNRLQAPTNDAVYRVVKGNNNLIVAQRENLTDLERRLKQLKLYNKTSAWQNSTIKSGRGNDSTELSNLADSLLHPPPSPVAAPSVSSGSGSINSDRLAQLREHLYRRSVPIVKSTKPENLSMSKIVMPTEHLQQLTSRERSPQRSPQRSAQRSPVPSTSGEFVGMRRRTTAKVTTQASRPAPAIAATIKSGPSMAASTALNVGKTSTVSQLSNRPAMGTKVMQGTSKPAVSVIGRNLPNLNYGTSPQSSGKPTFNLNQAVNASMKQGQSMPAQAPVMLTRVKEVNGIRLEDITPSQSEGDTVDEDDEYDDDEDDDDSESNGEGFGDEYNMPQPGTTSKGIRITSTPVATGTKPAGASTGTPVSRKLFGTGTDTSQSAGSFKFGSGDTAAPFNFGTASATQTKRSTDKPDTSAAKPFNFTPAVPTTSTTSAPGFNFSFSTGAPSFGVTKDPGTQQADATTGSGSVQPKGEETGTATTGLAFGSSTTGAPGAGLFGKTLQPGTSASGGSPTLKTSKSGSLLELIATADDEEPAGVSHGGARTDGATFTTSEISEAVSSGQGAPVLSSLLAKADSPPPSADSQQTSSTIGASVGQVTASSGAVDLSAPTTSRATPTSGLFGQSTSSSNVTPPNGLFGQSQTGSATSEGLFGQKPTSSSSDGLFSGPATTSSSSLFGTSTASTGGLFSGTSSSSDLFGQSATDASTTGTAIGESAGTSTATVSLSSGVFNAAPTTAASNGLFGQSTSTTGGLFGQAATTTSSTGGLFGQTPSTGSTGLFGQASTPTTASAGLFGQPAASSAASGLFGQTPATSTPSTGIFGQAADTTTSSTELFGQASAASTAPTGFGLFSQPATSQATGMFGSSTTGSGFGSPGFGQSAQATGFGQPAFGQSAVFPSPSSTSSSVFGQSTDASGSGGSFFGGLGGKPSEEKANTNVFGTAQAFGSANQATSGLFGSDTSKTFGTSAPGGETGGPFSGGAGGFGAGGTGVGSTGFGATQQPAAGGFGNPPAFGGGQAFGAAPTFGSGASFGSPPSYGSGGTFGSGATFGSSLGGGNAFGSSAPSTANTAAFAGFASGNSPTFGSLAQTEDAPTFGALGQPGGEGGNMFGGGGAQFGNPSFGGTGQQTSFGDTGQQSSPAFGGGGNTFGSNPSFTGYRS